MADSKSDHLEYDDGSTKAATERNDRKVDTAVYLNEHTEENVRPVALLEAPELIRHMTMEERQELEKKLIRKIDFRLLPMIILMYIMNYLDRNNLAAARLAGKVGLEVQLGLKGNEFQTCVSIFFVGYILMQVPSNLFLSKFGRPGVYLPTVMVIWGMLSAATSAAKGFGSLVAIRFLLGFIEAAYFPGCLYFLSSWYTRKELAKRTAIMYSGSLMSGAFSGLIAAGITRGLDGARGISAWRWLFIIEGVVTIFIALCAFFVLPNFPRTTSWLSEKERQLAIWRLQEDIGTDDKEGRNDSLIHGFKLAFTDPKTWILMLILSCIVSSAGVTNFFPTVVNTLGYPKIESLLLTAPPYVLAVITSLLNALHADRTGERFLHVTLPLVISVAAFIIAATTTATAPRYVSMMLMPASFYAGYVVALTWISNTLPRPPSKRAAALAGINAVSNATSIYVSYMYADKYGPRFVIAMGVNCGTALLAIVGAVVLRVWLARLNKQLDAGMSVEGVSSLGGEGEAEAEKRGFRFLL